MSPFLFWVRVQYVQPFFKEARRWSAIFLDPWPTCTEGRVLARHATILGVRSATGSARPPVDLLQPHPLLLAKPSIPTPPPVAASRQQPAPAPSPRPPAARAVHCAAIRDPPWRRMSLLCLMQHADGG